MSVERYAIETLEQAEALHNTQFRRDFSLSMENAIRIWRSMERKGLKAELHMYVKVESDEAGARIYAERRVPTAGEKLLCRLNTTKAKAIIKAERAAGRMHRLEADDQLDTAGKAVTYGA